MINRKNKDTSSDKPQCYFCPNDNTTCDNCMIQHILNNHIKLKTILGKYLKKYSVDHDESVHRDFFLGLLKDLEEVDIE